MPQEQEVIKTGQLTIRDGQPVLLCEGLAAWGLFLERDVSALLGKQVTVRASRFGFGMLHVTGIARGQTVPPPARESRLLVGSLVVLQGVAVLSLVWSLGRSVWALATEYLV